MRGLLGDRFLRRFTGDPNQRRMHRDFSGEGQNPEAEVDAAPGPEAVGPDVHTSEEDREEAVAGAQAVPSKTEPTKQNENEPKAD